MDVPNDGEPTNSPAMTRPADDIQASTSGPLSHAPDGGDESFKSGGGEVFFKNDACFNQVFTIAIDMVNQKCNPYDIPEDPEEQREYTLKPETLAQRLHDDPVMKNYSYPPEDLANVCEEASLCNAAERSFNRYIMPAIEKCLKQLDIQEERQKQGAKD